eukprot:m.155314 g.155314  ORF g.155314 m.155314 type:complete len:305 (+) comp23561_c0_seq1:72-986(+)
MAVFKHLHGTSLAALLSEQDVAEVITVKDTDTVELAIKRMSEARVLALPVIGGDGKICGMVDTLDIISFMASVAPEGEELTKEMLKSMECFGRAVAFMTVANIMDASGVNACVAFDEHTPSSAVLELFAQGTHRCPVLSSEELTGVLSQSTMVRHMEPMIRRGQMKDVAHKTLGDLGLGQVPVLSVGPDARVIDAINMISKNKVSALAICNKAGELVDNISATDLRGLERDDIPNILEPVGHFFLSHGIQRKPTITTPLWDTTLEECLTLLVKNNVHRVWIVGHAKNPVGVVSLTDICGVFNSH